MNDQLLDKLVSIVGTGNVLTVATDIAPFITDRRGRYTGQPLCVVRPGSVEQISSIVAACAEVSAAIVPQGGNTGLVGGATPSEGSQGQVVVNLTRLNRIRAIDIDNNTITAEAGCTLQQVQEAAAEAGRIFPLSLPAEDSATIGGNLSTNAGGIQVLRYGNMRNLTLGLEVVLPDGRLFNALRGLRKDNTGYDLKQMFIGAEGTLGLITAATLKLFPQLQDCATAWVAIPDPAAAVSLLNRLREACGDRISAFEIIGRSALELVLKHFRGVRDPLSARHEWQVLVELGDTLADADDEKKLNKILGNFFAVEIEAGRAIDAAIAQNKTQAQALWQLRKNISDAQRIEGISIKHDIALPISRIAAFIDSAGAALEREFPGVRIVCFGHIGDGNLHYNLSKIESEVNVDFIAQTSTVNRIVHDLVHKLGGSISAEHGLGQLKREEILRYKSGIEMELMHAIKNLLDPHCLMNPGKVL